MTLKLGAAVCFVAGAVLELVGFCRTRRTTVKPRIPVRFVLSITLTGGVLFGAAAALWAWVFAGSGSTADLLMTMGCLLASTAVFVFYRRFASL